MNTTNNKWFGNVAFNGGGFNQTARSECAPNTVNQMPTNSVLENNVVLNHDQWTAFQCRACKNFQMTNNSVFDGVHNPYTGYTGLVGVYWDLSCGTSCGEGGDGVATDFATNTLIVNAGPDGAFNVGNVAQWSASYVWAYNNASSSPGLGDGHYSHVFTSDPKLGACKVFIPSGSGPKGAGAGGADIGANILYRYQDGVLTNTPLWDPATGRFPCGAQVAGINDVAGSSCFDVHTRLNVNTNGCMLPTAAFPGPTLRVLGTTP
jgi:hypothetical protein